MTEPPTIIQGDSRDVLKTFDDGVFDAVVCDPPYALVSITKRFGKPDAAPPKGNDAYMRASTGFMGKAWDTGETAFDPTFWTEVLRVMKPGAHLVAFSGTRTYHRMACAIEDAGFEIRDQLQWLYGSGFPKSHDVSKGIDKAKGLAEERGYVDATGGLHKGTGNTVGKYASENAGQQLSSVPVSDEAKYWDGWGTALKPACEPIVLARAPLAKHSVVANVLAHGTGAINIDGCRIATDELKSGTHKRTPGTVFTGEGFLKSFEYDGSKGRWPANVIHDGSAEVVDAFPESESSRSIITSTGSKLAYDFPPITGEYGFDDSGSAARFFYSAKADDDDRLGSGHPTVKPVDLMQWLVRLVTPRGGLVLDPFAGTGTTGEAAWREGMRCTLVEREETYVADIKRRMTMLSASPFERRISTIKAQGRVADAGPLFECLQERAAE